MIDEICDVSNKVNAVSIVYKIRDYSESGTANNYLFSCGMDKNHHDVCFLSDERTMRVYGAATAGSYIDVKDFPTSYYYPVKDTSGTLCASCMIKLVRLMHLRYGCIKTVLLLKHADGLSEARGIAFVLR